IPEVGMCASAGRRKPLGEQISQSVQCHISHQGRANGALGCAFRRPEELFVLEVARLQPCFDLPTSWEIPESLVDVGMTDMESRWGAWPAFRRVGFPTALPRTGRATLAASGSPGWPGYIAGASAGDGRCGTSRSFGPDTPLALGWSCSSRQCNGALLRRGWRIG